ncbi:hypothetical protein ACWGKQ_37725 [Streptomyces sp. NPDC054770]
MKLKNAVCAGTITLISARSAIKTDWTMVLAVTGIGCPLYPREPPPRDTASAR